MIAHEYVWETHRRAAAAAIASGGARYRYDTKVRHIEQRRQVVLAAELDTGAEARYVFGMQPRLQSMMRERMSVCMEAHEVLAFYAVFLVCM